MTATAPVAGWFDDPHGGGQLRWWDGSQWTDHLTPHPQPAAPAVPEAVPTPALHVVPDHVVPDPAPSPAPVPVPAPVPAPGPGPAAGARVTVPAATARRSAPSRRTTAIVVGAGLVLVALAALALTLRGGDGAAATADAASGPPLTAQQYATELQSIAKAAEASASGDLDPDTMTAAQVEAALVPMREALARGKALSPPAHVKVQHDALFTQLEQAMVQVEALAANPKDESAMMSLMASVFAAAATIQQLEQQLGIDLDGEPSAADAPKTTGAPGATAPPA